MQQVRLITEKELDQAEARAFQSYQGHGADKPAMNSRHTELFDENSINSNVLDNRQSRFAA